MNGNCIPWELSPGLCGPVVGPIGGAQHCDHLLTLTVLLQGCACCVVFPALVQRGGLPPGLCFCREKMITKTSWFV